jgi:hypothetical protein
MNIDLLSWILIVQIWTADEPGQINLVYRKEYPNYEQCMEARKEWIDKKLVAICGVESETNKDAPTNLETSSRKTTHRVS